MFQFFVRKKAMSVTELELSPVLADISEGLSAEVNFLDEKNKDRRSMETAETGELIKNLRSYSKSFFKI